MYKIGNPWGGGLPIPSWEALELVGSALRGIGLGAGQSRVGVAWGLGRSWWALY
jgi:hypothetical protein